MAVIRSWNEILVGCLAVLATVIVQPVSPLVAQRAALEPDPIRRITLDQAIVRLEVHNLDLRLAREAAAAAEARVITAGAMPNPGFSALREQLSGDSGDYHETSLVLSQTLELGGQRGLRRGTARGMADAAGLRLEATRSRLAFEVHQAYLRAAAAESDLAVLTETTEVFRRVEESGRKRFTEGDISRLDRNRIQIELARYETLLARAQLALRAASRELTLLVAPDSIAFSMFLPAEMLSEHATEASIPSLEAALLAATGRSDVRAAEAEVAAAEAALTLQRRIPIPDLTLSSGYKRQADGFQGAVVGVSVPLPLWNRNRGGIAEAEVNLSAALARRELVLHRAENDIRRAWETYRSLDDRKHLLGEILLPESAGLLEAARLAYAEGEMSLIELLDTADAYRGARESTNSLFADHLIARYDLQRAIGRYVEPRSAPTGTFH